MLILLQTDIQELKFASELALPVMHTNVGDYHIKPVVCCARVVCTNVGILICAGTCNVDLFPKKPGYPRFICNSLNLNYFTYIKMV